MASSIPTIQKINAGVRHVKGEAWEYKWVSPKYVLRKIYVSHSQHAVDYLQFVISDDTGRETIVSEKYSGEAAGSATNFTVVELDVGEQITTIRGFYCYDVDRQRNVLGSITFCTSRRMTSGSGAHGGYGGVGGGSTYYGPYGSNYKDPYGSTSNGPASYYPQPIEVDYQTGESRVGSTNRGSASFYGLPFCFEMGQSFSGFHGTTIDGQIKSIGVFISDRVVTHDDEEIPASRGRVRH